MNILLNDDVGAGARTIPVFWRDYAWRVRIFVRTRIGARRQMLRARVLDNNKLALERRIKIWGAGHGRICGRSAALRLQRSRMQSARGLFTPRFVLREDRSLPLPVFRAERRGQGNLGISLVRTVANPRRRSRQTVLKPKGCAPALPGLSAAMERLRPVLAFASSQLGGLAPSAMRIYSVFEYSLPTTI